MLGWAEWREICLHHSVGLVAALLADGMQRGTIKEQPVDPLTHILVGAVDEAALYVARAPDQGRARSDVRRSSAASLPPSQTIDGRLSSERVQVPALAADQEAMTAATAAASPRWQPSGRSASSTSSSAMSTSSRSSAAVDVAGVDGDHGAGDVAGLVGGEPGDGVGDVDRLDRLHRERVRQGVRELGDVL